MERRVTQGRDLLLYLPGVDGLNVEAAEQFDFLSASFDAWCMTVQESDKSTFEQLTDQVGTISLALRCVERIIYLLTVPVVV